MIYAKISKNQSSISFFDEKTANEEFKKINKMFPGKTRGYTVYSITLNYQECALYLQKNKFIPISETFFYKP